MTRRLAAAVRAAAIVLAGAALSLAVVARRLER